MHMKANVALAILFLYLLLYANVGLKTGETLTPEDQLFQTPTFQASSYYDSSPILIMSNEDLMQQAVENSWVGDGSLEKPFIIEALNITRPPETMTLIDIRNTSVYFILRSSLLIGGSIGIQFQDVVNGQAFNNTIYHSTGLGIYMYECENCTLRENRVHDNTNRGILVDYTEQCQIESNTVFENSEGGITLRDSPNNLVFCNKIYDITGDGVYLGNSPFCTIDSNIIHDNSNTGVVVAMSTPVEISNCTIYNNLEEGIVVSGAAAASEIHNSTLYHNGFYGIRVFADYTVVKFNNFIENGFDYTTLSQAGTMGQDCIFSDNYWDVWTYPDEDKNGVVDSPYLIDSEDGTADSSPHISAFPNNALHIITKPQIVYPIINVISPDYINGSTFFFGDMQVIWGTSSDTFGHDVFYDVQYSDSDGLSWTNIAVNISDTEIFWDTTSLPQNLTYMLRVIARCENGLSSYTVLGMNYTILEHTVSVPSIFSPKNGSTVDASFELMWLPAFDSWHHRIYYEISYSDDSGASWAILFEEYDGSSLMIFARDMPDGEYLYRVVAKCSEDLTNSDTVTLQFQTHAADLQGRILIALLVVGGIVFIVVAGYWYKKWR